MLRVAQHLDARQGGRGEGTGEGVDRSVTGSREAVRRPVDQQLGLAGDRAVAFRALEVADRDGRGAVEVLAAEHLEDLGRREFGALGVGDVVHDAADLLVHGFRQGVAELVLQHVGDAAFAGLGVDADDRAVAAADIGRVDRDVEHVPRLARFPGGPGLLDGVLVRAAESSESQLAGVRLARRHLEAGAALVDLADAVDVAEVQTRMNAVGVQVQGDGDDVEVAGAFAVAEERALDAVGAREEREFGRGDAGAPVVVRVKRDQGTVAPREVAAHPLDLVGVHIGRGVLHRGRKIQDDLILDGRLPRVGDRLADLEGKIELGAGEAFRRVLEAQARAGGDERGRVVFDPLGALHGDAADVVARGVEDMPALRGRSGVVQVEDRVSRPAERLDAADDELLAALAKDLDRDVVGDQPALDQPATEIELDLRGARKTNLDLLEADAHQHRKVLEFLVHAHRLGERLVAVAQVDTAPERSARECAARPLAIREVDRREGPVLGDGGGLHGRKID